MELYCSLALSFGIVMYRIGGRLGSIGRQSWWSHPWDTTLVSTGILTGGHESGDWRHCQVGSLTGAVAS